ESTHFDVLTAARCAATMTPRAIGIPSPIRLPPTLRTRLEPFMARDLSTLHEIVGDLLHLPKTAEEWDQYRLTDDQVAFFHENGYLAGVPILTDRQVDALRAELANFFDPNHEGHELWYEYHTNES